MLLLWNQKSEVHSVEHTPPGWPEEVLAPHPRLNLGLVFLAHEQRVELFLSRQLVELFPSLE